MGEMMRVTSALAKGFVCKLCINILHVDVDGIDIYVWIYMLI